MSTDPHFVELGSFGSSYGIKGYKKFFPYGETLSSLLPPFSCTVKSDGGTRQISVTDIQKRNSYYLVKVEGIDTPEAGPWLTGAKLLWPKSDLPPLNDLEIYVEDLVGLVAISFETGEPLGYCVSRVLDNPVHPILEFSNREGNPTVVLVPFLNLFVGDWNLAERTIELKNWEQWFAV